MWIAMGCVGALLLLGWAVFRWVRLTERRAVGAVEFVEAEVGGGGPSWSGVRRPSPSWRPSGAGSWSGWPA
ncbi:hypothetical protein ACFQ0T_12635 [Kitasatospora gansuensis]